jgi:hypothetical protein
MGRTKGAKGKHNKEKPHKEKKQRGRPKGSIKQKQHQHQNVNVKVINNNGGGGGGAGGGGKITIPVPFQLPSTMTTVYDQSLVQPFYGINNRQPVNPLTDASTDLMTPFLQSMISNQTANRPNPGGIKEKDVTPVNPVIPKPKEEIMKNPQTDQSHPIRQEDINIVSDLNLPIHNKHQQHKTIKDMIKPQVPKEIKPPKFKDTEGLGMKIPVQNIAGIATTIASGGLTGGIIAGGEALLTGSGLAASLEAASAGAVGGGVATAVNNALGGGDVGHVISGIAGGIAGRTAITRARTGNRLGGRQTNVRNIEGENIPIKQPDETTPLINSGKGNKLGGKTKTSKLIGNQEEIQQTHDPLTGETTQWRLPTEEQRTMLDKVKKAAKRTMENLSDTVHNIRQQITGRNKKGGTYARIPSGVEMKENSALGRFDKDVTSQKEFDDFINKPQPNPQEQLFKLIDRRKYGDDEYDIENVLKKMRKESSAATKIQSAMRNKKARGIANNKMAEQQGNDLTSQIMDGTFNDLEDIFQTQKEQKTAANFILSKIKSKKSEPSNHILQKVVRDNISKQKKLQLEGVTQKQTKQILENALHEVNTEGNAATKIQNALRNKQARKEISKQYNEKLQKDVSKQRYNDLVSSGEIEKSSLERVKRINSRQNAKEIKEKNAATAIQSAIRNKQAKKQLKNAKFERELDDTAKIITRKTLRAANKEIKQDAGRLISDTAKRRITNQKELRKGISKIQNRISELDTRTPTKMNLAFSKKGLTKVTPQIKAEEKQYLRKIEEQYKKYYIPLKEPRNTRASSPISVASSRLSTAGTLGYKTPAKK